MNESPDSTDEETPGLGKIAGPTPQDIENAETRRVIADKQLEEYTHCLKLALGALGPGWTPWMKLVLIESDYHLHRDKPLVAGATVYKVYRGELRLSENARYLIEDADGQVRHADSYEALVGGLLDEKHPSYGLTLKGEWIPHNRWSVTWAALELYAPKSAEELAALRISRERGKAEREAKKFIEENPLLAWGLNKGEDD